MSNHTERDNFTNFGCVLVDKNNNRVIDPVVSVNSQSFSEKFLLMASSSEDMYYNVILLSNYKQVDFQINQSEEKKQHEIFLEKTPDEKLKYSNIQISTQDLSIGRNDCILVFTREQKKDNKASYGFGGDMHTRRFVVVNNEPESPKIDISVPYEGYKVIDGKPNHIMSVFNKEFEKIKENHYQEYTLLNYVDNVKTGQYIDLPTCIYLEDLINGTNFLDRYLNDVKSKARYRICFFAIVNGNLYPLFYEGEKSENYKIFDVQLGNTIIINPKIKFEQEGVYNIHLLSVVYPFEYQNDFLQTYKMRFWSSGLNSQRVTINVNP